MRTNRKLHFVLCAALLSSGCTWIFSSVQRNESTVGCIENQLEGYGGGSGTSSDPYLICSAAQWNKLGGTSSDWSKSFKLASDIDLTSYSGSAYQKIGDMTTKFSGSVNGAGYRIKNLTLNSTTYAALFGYVNSPSFSNLVLENFNITSTSSAAPLFYDLTGTAQLSSVTVTSSAIVGVPAAGIYIGTVSGVANCTTCKVLNTTITANATNSFVSGIAYGGGGTHNLTDITLTNVTLYPGLSAGFGAGLVLQANTISVNRAQINIDMPNQWGTASAGVTYLLMGAPTSTIQNVTVTGSIRSGTASAGLVVYPMFGPLTISDSVVNATIVGVSAGGLVHQPNRDLTISRSGVQGTIIGTGASGVGGFVHTTSPVGYTTTISDSYVQANVSIPNGQNNVAGFVNQGNNGTLNLNRNYFSGTIVGNVADNARACFMVTTTGTLNSADNFYDSTTCTLGKGRQSGVMAGVTPQNTFSMQPSSAFTNWNNGNWIFSSGVYPKLVWE